MWEGWTSRSSKIIYVGNLHGDVREREVEDLFYKFRPPLVAQKQAPNMCLINVVHLLAQTIKDQRFHPTPIRTLTFCPAGLRNYCLLNCLPTPIHTDPCQRVKLLDAQHRPERW